MRTSRRVPVPSGLLAAALAALIYSHLTPARAETGPSAPQAAASPSCKNSCRGLGIEKVKAGDEHCGLVPRARKDESLDAACRLAEGHREELQRQAEEKAREKCADEVDRRACRCRSELRDWQNVYTHVLSQRCWTQCGWAVLVECERRDTDAGDDDR